MVFASGVSDEQVAALGDVVTAVSFDGWGPDEVKAALGAAQVSPSDTRARMVAAVGGDALTVVGAYAAFCGMAGRPVDVAFGGETLQAEVLVPQVAAKLGSMPPPPVRADRVVARGTSDQVPPVGAEEGVVVDVPVDADAPLQQMTGEQLQQLRFARRCTVVVPDDGAAALRLVVLLSAARVRDGGFRLPEVVSPAGAADLEGVRKAAGELRRDIRPYVTALAPSQPLPARLQRLQLAAAVPVEEALTLLGAAFNAEVAAWHCPRPERHANGDASPSTQVEEGKVRCYRCDPEWVDALRLTADTLGVSADEGADILLDRPGWADGLVGGRVELQPPRAG